MYTAIIMSLLAALRVATMFDPPPVVDAPETQQIDYQKSAEQSGWVWNDAETNPLFCMGGPHDYEISITQPSQQGGWKPLRISFSKNGIEKYAFDGHARSVFGIDEDMLYRAEFLPSSSGCRVRCVDLTTGAEKWTATLRGIGPVQHSAYANLINLRVSRDVIVIYGNESMGQYLELVDKKTGVTVGHRLFERIETDARVIALRKAIEDYRSAAKHDPFYNEHAETFGFDLHVDPRPTRPR